MTQGLDSTQYRLKHLWEQAEQFSFLVFLFHVFPILDANNNCESGYNRRTYLGHL